MIVNNWFVLMDGFVAVTSDWARIYFVVFYVITVLICVKYVLYWMFSRLWMHWCVRFGAHVMHGR